MAGPRLRFPLTNEDDYKGTITFAAKVEEDLSASILNDLSRASARAPDAIVNTPADYEAFEGRPSTPESVFSRFSRTNGAVTLYLPPQMTFNDGVEYQNVDLGIAGAAGERAIQSGASGSGVVGAMLSGALPDIDSVLEGLRGSLGSETAALAALRTVGRVSDTAANVVSSTTGVTLNPNRRTILRGVGIRNFNFTFNLIPTTRQEAESIKSIIDFFRTEIYPEDIDVGGVAVGYRFPNKFQITMRYGGRRIAHGILPCFLQNIQTTYNPNNMSFHRDGNFPETTITLNFVEERSLRKQDIIGGF